MLDGEVFMRLSHHRCAGPNSRRRHFNDVWVLSLVGAPGDGTCSCLILTLNFMRTSFFFGRQVGRISMDEVKGCKHPSSHRRHPLKGYLCGMRTSLFSSFKCAIWFLSRSQVLPSLMGLRSLPGHHTLCPHVHHEDSSSPYQPRQTDD